MRKMILALMAVMGCNAVFAQQDTSGEPSEVAVDTSVTDSHDGCGCGKGKGKGN